MVVSQLRSCRRRYIDRMFQVPSSQPRPSGWSAALHPAALLYSIAAIVSRAIRARALICLFSQASGSAVKPPCFRAFWFPCGDAPAAPCIRQTA